MYLAAYLILLVALLASLAGSALACLQLWEGRENLAKKIEIPVWIIASALILGSGLLLHALFWQDYRVEYVASYIDSFLPVFYRLTAFWAGQPGSMLFWALVTGLFGCAFAPLLRKQHAPVRLWYWCFFYAIMAFFCLILTSWSNPFLLQSPAPADGSGLNPLLQNPGMIIHPPLLFMGYAGFTIPACLGLAQLLARPATGPAWFLASRPFYLVSWLFLSAGIILGAWWAYMELGWGGYWAWDPVENASLLPWLTSTAAIHIIIVDRHSGKLDRTAVALMSVSVAAAFFATYLTRSGVIQSVHAFGDGGVGTPLSIFVCAAVALIAMTVFLAPREGSPLQAFFSREGALVLVSWFLIALALIISIATMWPVITKAWGQVSQGLDASFYNRVCVPLFIALIVLMAFCIALKWRGGWRELLLPLFIAGAFIIALAIIFLAGYAKFWPLVAASAACASLTAVFLALFNPAIRQSPTGRAALGAHAGAALMALGIAFSGPYTTDKELLLSRGQTERIGPYSVSLEAMGEGRGPGYDYLRATLRIMDGGKLVGSLQPERRIYDKFGDMQFSEVDVIPGLWQDIYASLLGMDENMRILTRISLEPLVNWIWIGGFALCLLPLAGLWTCRRSQKPDESGPSC